MRRRRGCRYFKELKGKGLLMNHDKPGLSDAVDMVNYMTKDAAVAVITDVDNGYVVVFHPPKRGAGFNPHGNLLAVGQGSYTAEEQQKVFAETQVRNHALNVATLKMRMRVRVYPGLSQAMEDIKKFYESGGIVPGIDFDKDAERMGDRAEGLVFGA